MLENEHPLLTKRAQGFIAVLAFATALGIALMSFRMLVLGLLVSIAGSLGATWIYADDFQRIRIRYANENGSLVRISHEIWLAISLLLAAVIIPVTIFLHASTPTESDRQHLRQIGSQREARHLTVDQKARLRDSLKLGQSESYELQINSAPSCEECEVFSEEIRAFLNTIPGWRAGGGPLIFPAPVRRGLELVRTEEDKKSPPVEQLEKAFAGAGMRLRATSDGAARGLVVILINRAES